MGLDPYRMLRRAGLPVAALDHPDYQIPADRVQALLADCANSAASEDFGLLVGKAFRLSMKGPLGLLMREQPTVRESLDVLQRYLRYQNDNVEIRLAPQGDDVAVVPELISPRTTVSRQMVDLTLAMYVQIFRGLLGESWRPACVFFARAAPTDPAPYESLGRRLEFGAPSTGFLLTQQDLATHNPDADPQMAREIALYIEANAQPQGVSATEQVSALIRRLLPGGDCNVDRVAQLMGVDRRTVHRRLAAEGGSFTHLLDAIRREVAVRQLVNTDRQLGEVALLVGFSSLSTFSRWFRQAFGMQPSEYRRGAHSG
ncbi:MAG TPA: AraC family transcriptional regulator [Chloroflexota bacterium]